MANFDLDKRSENQEKFVHKMYDKLFEIGINDESIVGLIAIIDQKVGRTSSCRSTTTTSTSEE